MQRRTPRDLDRKSVDTVKTVSRVFAENPRGIGGNHRVDSRVGERITVATISRIVVTVFTRCRDLHEAGVVIGFTLHGSDLASNRNDSNGSTLGES